MAMNAMLPPQIPVGNAAPGIPMQQTPQVQNPLPQQVQQNVQPQVQQQQAPVATEQKKRGRKPKDPNSQTTALAVPQEPATHEVIKVKLPIALAEGVKFYEKQNNGKYIFNMVLADMLERGVLGWVNQPVQQG